MKRIISFILLLCMLLVSLNVSFAMDFEDVSSETVKEATDILSDMGIITGYDDDTFREDNNITRAEFAVMMTRMQRMNETSESDRTYYYDVPTDHWAAGSINQLSQKGIINGYDDGSFGINNNVTIEEAYKMLLCLAGYGTVAEANGGYPKGYITTAASSGLTDNIKGTGSELLTRGQAAILIYNTLNLKLWTQNSLDKIEKSDTTFIEYYWNLIKVEGTVTTVPGTSFYEGNSFIQQIGIAGINYETELDIPLDMLGRYVVAYYEDVDNGRVLYIHEKATRTKELVIQAETIDEVTSDGSIRYWVNNSRKTERIDPKACVIYNGIAVGEYKYTDFDIDYGSIRLLQTSGSGFYDLVFIESYYDLPVSSIDLNNYTVYSALGINLKLEDSDFDRIVIKDMDGKALSFNDISIDDVLTVKQAGDEYVDVTVCREALTGIIGTIGYDDDDTVIEVDGELYSIYKPYAEKFNASFKSGSEITAYIDAFNNIAYAKTPEGSKDPVGYIVKGWFDESGEDFYLKLFTYDGEMKQIKVASRVTIDGESMTDSGRAFRALSENDYTVDAQMVVYRLNSNNEINYIDTAERKSNENEYSFSVSLPMASYRVKENGTLGGKGFIKGTTQMLCVPADEELAKSSDSDYSIRAASTIMTNVYRNLETYKVAPKIGYESIVLMKGGKSDGIGEFSYCALVKKVMETVTDDGEITKLISYVSPSGETEKMIDPDEVSSIPSVEKGDLVLFGINNEDMIDTVEFVIRNGKTPTMGSGYFYDSLNSVDVIKKFTYGCAVEKEGSIVRVGYNGTDSWDEAANITSCIIYNTDTCDITYGTANDILTAEEVGDGCDKIFLQYHYSDIFCCVVYRQSSEAAGE